MAHGIRQGTLGVFSPKMNGKEEENDGAAWMAGKLIFPMGQLSSNPKMPRTKNIEY